MADRMQADLDLIKDCSKSLFRIHREFDEHGNPAEDYRDDLGVGNLRDAFDEFSDNWKKSRKKLMKDIEALAKYTAEAAKAYEDIDHKLAEALRDAKKSKKKEK